MSDNVIRVFPLGPIHDWFMRKKDFDGEDGILISALINVGILEYAAPGAPRPKCRECEATRPCATHDTPRLPRPTPTTMEGTDNDGK